MSIRKNTILAFAVTAMYCAPLTVAADSFSEMNMQLFNKMVRPEAVRREANPFTEGASMADDLMIEDLQLLGVVIGSADAYALISGFVVEEGDLIAGFKVMSVDRKQVVLRQLDEVFVLSVGGGL